MLAVYSHTLCKSSSKCPSHFASLWNVCCLYAVSYKALARRGICCLFFEEKILQWVFFLFFFFFLAFLFVCLILIKHTVLIVFHRRLARLVVGPFCAWNCTGGGPSVHVIKLCSGRLHASMWSWRSCCEKFWCICAASCASIAFPQALFRSLSRAEDHSCTDISGILLASCMAGTTILLLSLWFPNT